MPDPQPAVPAPARSARLTVLLPVGALAAFVAAAGILRIRSVDFFWHLAAGRWMLEHGRLPRLDPFRFTSQGAAWVDHEWGFQLLLAAVEAAGGLTALVWLRAALVALVAALVLTALLRRGVGVPAAVLVTLVALLGARPRFLFRPELVTLLAFTVLMLLLGRLRRRGDWLPVAGLAVLAAVWANVHPGVLVAPAVAGAYLLGGWWEGRAGGSSGAFRLSPAHVVGVPALLALAALANPWGVDLYRVPGRIRAALAGLDAVNPDWAPLWEAPQPFLFLSLAALAALLTLAWRRRRRIDPAAGLATLVLVPLVVSSARHQGLLFVAGAFLAGEALRDPGGPVRDRSATPGGGEGAADGSGLASRAIDGTAQEVGAGASPDLRSGDAAAAGMSGGAAAADTGAFPERGPWRAPALATAACLLAAVWCLWPPSRGPLAPGWVRHQVGFGIAPGRFPEGAAEELARWEPVGNLLNSAVFGGYLLWRLYPPRQIFLDTRNEVHPELLRELARARVDSRLWADLLERYSIDGALVRYDDRPRPIVDVPAEPGGEERVEHHTPTAFLFPPERFALVYWDDVSMLFLARRPERQAALAGPEYRYVQPEDWRATLERAARDSAFRRGALDEVRRKLARDPGCRRAAELLRALTGPGL